MAKDRLFEFTQAEENEMKEYIAKVASEMDAKCAKATAEGAKRVTLAELDNMGDALDNMTRL